MITFVSADNSQFVIAESVFRFGADVRSGDDPREAQLRLIRDGEAQSLTEDENTRALRIRTMIMKNLIMTTRRMKRRMKND